MESNHRPPPYQGGALPTELRERKFHFIRRLQQQTHSASVPISPDKNPPMERETGIEPALVAWKATVLPLNYSRPEYFSVSSFQRNPEFNFAAFSVCIRWRDMDYLGHPALHPPDQPCGLFKFASGEFVERYFAWVILIHPRRTPIRFSTWWREVDSNHRRHEPADLQSAPVGRLGIPPRSRLFSASWIPAVKDSSLIQAG